MIRTIVGSEVKAVRYATQGDVQEFKVDAAARRRRSSGSAHSFVWVVITRADDTQRLVHIGNLIADGGLSEIVRATAAGGAS